jgi:hypothetical protein
MTTILLKAAPGGPEFIKSLVSTAADMSLALAFVGEPVAHLEQARENLSRDLAETMGADVAALIAQAFVAAVVGRRREIEAAGAMQRAVN